MIPGARSLGVAADDGDLITAGSLSALRAGFVRQAPPLLAGRLSLGLPAPVLVARPATASGNVRAQTRAWLSGRIGHHYASDPAEEALLHAVETSALVRPPVPKRVATVDAELAELYLWLCRHWIGITRATADPRYLNAALKLLAVCLTAPVPPTSLAVAVLSQALETLDTLPRPRPARLPAATPVAERPAPTARDGRIAVMAGADSKGLPLFLDAARTAGFSVAGVVLHQDRGGSPAPDSVYASAWYPSPRQAAVFPAGRAALVDAPAAPTVRVAHRDWPNAAAALTEWKTDLLVLIGMDVVPATVLDAPRTGTVNAHNGALPAYRGMDAVAWAVLAGDRPVCSVHTVTEAVDAGDVLAQREVPADSPDLRQAVKDAQISLLTEVCAGFARSGELPSGRRQHGTARRFYRMHPALRRLLDTTYSPGAPR
ncbi:formyltransferase family protein [Streptomyces sp. NBC_00102]|uniref:formyltransferase family protein n=1 Tax=Streptomyces sp. NBC_00102 TaxID=2975652 RepID=UPI0022521576|nr:formyltransferase family protein [Streptomyces sp. NBC_00102]MCX5402281.1 formyltransferase family protein [Streptomyces sp. NBC_00102]